MVATPKRKTTAIAITMAILRKTDAILVAKLTKCRSLASGMSRGKPQISDKEAVAAVCVRPRAETRMTRIEGADLVEHFLVFFQLDGAGGINQAATGF